MTRVFESFPNQAPGSHSSWGRTANSSRPSSGRERIWRNHIFIKTSSSVWNFTWLRERSNSWRFGRFEISRGKSRSRFAANLHSLEISVMTLLYLVGKSNFETLDLWDGQNFAGDVQGSYRKQKTTPAFRDLLKFVILWWFSRYLTPTDLFRKRCEPVLVEEEGLQVAGEQDWLIKCVWICWKALQRDSRKCMPWQILKYFYISTFTSSQSQ